MIVRCSFSCLFIFCFLLFGIYGHPFYNWEKVLKGKRKLPICIGYILYEGPRTIEHTLQSYNKSGILSMVEESKIFYQQIDRPDREVWLDYFNSTYGSLFSHPPIISRTNKGFEVFRLLAESCSTDYILILEEDFFVKYNRTYVAYHLTHAMNLISLRTVDAIRLRAINDMGRPNMAERFFKAGQLSIHATIDQIVWNRTLETYLPGIVHICAEQPKTWCTTSYYASYTNNPVLYRKHMLLDIYYHPDNYVFSKRSVETLISGYWIERNYKVAWSNGLFTHHRFDRHAILSNLQTNQSDSHHHNNHTNGNFNKDIFHEKLINITTNILQASSFSSEQENHKPIPHNNFNKNNRNHKYNNVNYNNDMSSNRNPHLALRRPIGERIH